MGPRYQPNTARQRWRARRDGRAYGSFFWGFKFKP